MSLTVQECITWLEFARPECASDAEKMDAVITHLRTIAEPIRCDNPVDHGEREGGQDDDRTVAGSLGSPPMTDRDALIERVSRRLKLRAAETPSVSTVRLSMEDVAALISLASPSPAQTEAPNSSADGDLAAANPQPGEGRAGSPAQWPEDDGGHEWAESTIGPGNWQCRLCGIDSSKAGTEGKYLCEAKKRPALATLPPPEGPLSSDSIGKLPDERVKGLVEALEQIAHPPYGLGFNRLRGLARSALASYRGGA